MKCLVLAAVLSLLLASVLGQEIKSARMEVKRFINEHLPKYPNVELKYIGGADPVMIFLDAEGQEVERVSVMKMSEDEINDLLQSKGFAKREESDEEETDRTDL